MTIPSEDSAPANEAHATPGDLSDSIVDLPRQTAERYDQVAVGEVSMPLEVGDGVVDVSPRHLELVPDANDPSRYAAIIRRHKKEAVFIGTVTTAAVLAGVAAIRYAKKKK